MMRVFLVSLLVAGSLLAVTSTSWAQNAQIMVSWGASCPTIVRNQDFTGPGTYHLWVGAKNLSPADKNYGYDVRLFYGPGVPDAWRFDDAGCQTGSKATAANVPNSPSCPALLGGLPLAITGFDYDNQVPQRMMVILAVAYDDLTPAAGGTYTLWDIHFDHASSVAGTDSDPATCDNAGEPLTIGFADPTDPNWASYMGLSDGSYEKFHFADPADQFVSWNTDHAPVATKPVTWARVKGLYR